MRGFHVKWDLFVYIVLKNHHKLSFSPFGLLLSHLFEIKGIVSSGEQYKLSDVIENIEDKKIPFDKKTSHDAKNGYS